MVPIDFRLSAIHRLPFILEMVGVTPLFIAYLSVLPILRSGRYAGDGMLLRTPRPDPKKAQNSGFAT